jgi:hypothetical protein
LGTPISMGFSVRWLTVMDELALVGRFGRELQWFPREKVYP